MGVEVEDLRRVRFLAPLKDRAIKRLASHMREMHAAAGEEVVTQGGHAVAFFVILDGTATVTLRAVAPDEAAAERLEQELRLRAHRRLRALGVWT